MATVSRGLPARPHLDVPKRQANELLESLRSGRPEALERVRHRHPKYQHTDDAVLAAATFKLSDAQLVIAREYGFSHWAELKLRIEGNPQAQALDAAIRNRDAELVGRLLREFPALLHLPVRSSNWGPPMSHAANLGLLEMVQAIAALGAQDFQHAFDRAVLQGHTECARWLHAHGARLAPGLAMGPCETLNAAGLRLLVELGAPLTDAHGNRMAPLGHVLGTYSRNPKGKHAVLAIFAEQGYRLPETPIMALHRGDVEGLRRHLQRDPGLLQRRFGLREIYPEELGCAGPGMHGTPLDGTTLLHLAIDYDEQEIFDLLLGCGADVNARALVDSEGFGGHTPLFNTVVHSANGCGWQPDALMARELIKRGASREIRASLRKFLDWQDEPRWHVARDVTPAGWGRSFPIQSWVSAAALALVEEA